jgi:hypothetical protein
MSENAAVHAEFVKRFAAQDPSIVELLHPDLVVHEPPGLPYGGEYHGPDGFMELTGKLRARFDVTIRDGVIHHAGGKIVGIMRLTFDPTDGNSPTDMSIAEVYSFREEKISEIDVYYKDTKLIADLLAPRSATQLARASVSSAVPAVPAP